jgi:hypothetical protein
MLKKSGMRVVLLELTATAFRLATLRTSERTFAIAGVDRTLCRDQRRGTFNLETMALRLEEATRVVHSWWHRVE